MSAQADRRKMEVNRRKWDEAVPWHVRSESYDVPAFLRGRSTLHALEIEEMGSVRGLSLLHLQCHFGLDTLSWARRGATVTGIDFSPPAIRAARRLARETGLPARFVRSNVYDLPTKLRGTFDRVYTAKGALCWLPDLGEWARVVARFLAPGGRFYLLEDHPMIDLYDNEPGTQGFVLSDPYFRRAARREEYDGTYATDVRMKHRVSYDWVHPVSDVLGSLMDAGLEVRAVHEFPYTYWKRFDFMKRAKDGWWHLTKREGLLPLMWSVAAEKAGLPSSEGGPTRRARGNRAR